MSASLKIGLFGIGLDTYWPQFTDNTNSRYRFPGGARNFANRWNGYGPAHHCAVESLRKALVDPDKATLDTLVLDELTYGHSNGLIQDKAAFEAALLSKSSDFVTMDLTDQTVKIVGNTAWVRHTLTAATHDGGKPGTTHLSVLLVWLKQKGQWRLFARQAIKVEVQ